MEHIVVASTSRGTTATTPTSNSKRKRSRRIYDVEGKFYSYVSCTCTDSASHADLLALFCLVRPDRPSHKSRRWLITGHTVDSIVVQTRFRRRRTPVLRPHKAVAIGWQSTASDQHPILTTYLCHSPFDLSGCQARRLLHSDENRGQSGHELSRSNDGEAENV